MQISHGGHLEKQNGRQNDQNIGKFSPHGQQTVFRIQRCLIYHMIQNKKFYVMTESFF